MCITGEVKKGLGLGRKLGFPTVNLDVGDQCLQLEFGVYGCQVVLADKSIFKGALHFGPKGDFKEKEPHFEVHILDFEGDLYGQKVEVNIGEKIRDVQKFESIDELKLQIGKDVECAKGQEYS